MELKIVDEVTEENALAVFGDLDRTAKLAGQLTEIADTVQDFDLSTQKGRKECASAARKFASAKTKLDALGKALVDPMKAKTKVIDANRKLIRDTCDQLKLQIRKPLADFEQAERERMEAHQNAIQYINDLAERENQITGQRYTAEELKISLDEALQITVSAEICQEYAEEYANAKHRAIITLKELISQAEKEEAEQAELADLRRQKAEREEADRQAEAEKQAEAAALRRIEAQKKAEAEEEAQRLADREHISRIRTQAKQGLMNYGLNQAQAKDLVLAIHNGLIPNVTINY